VSPAQLIFKQLASMNDESLQKALFKKMAPPLVTLLSAEPEIQYVALRNINLIVQKYPAILAHEVKVRLRCGRAVPRSRLGPALGLSAGILELLCWQGVS
jgi:hypothetical protein